MSSVHSFQSVGKDEGTVPSEAGVEHLSEMYGYLDALEKPAKKDEVHCYQ